MFYVYVDFMLTDAQNNAATDRRRLVTLIIGVAFIYCTIAFSRSQVYST